MSHHPVMTPVPVTPPEVPSDVTVHLTTYTEDPVIGPYIELSALDDPELIRVCPLNPRRTTPRYGWEVYHILN